MSSLRYYRGGSSLRVRTIDIVIDPTTGLLRTDRGISVQDSPDGLEKFGGANEVTYVPSNLHVVRRGHRPGHYEIAPAVPMTPDEYEQAIAQVVLVSVTQ